MQNVEQLKRSIRSAEDLVGVVRTMETMAAVSIRQYETAADALAEYSRTITTGLGLLLQNQGHELSENQQAEPLANTTTGNAHDNWTNRGSIAARQTDMPNRTATPGDRTGVIIFGSDQGMCGQFNEQLAQYAREQIEDPGSLTQQKKNDTESFPCLCVGHRIAASLSAAGIEPIHTLATPGSATGITMVVHDLLPVVDSWRTEHHVGRIFVLHNRRLSAATWKPHIEQLLPLNMSRLLQVTSPQKNNRCLPMWTMPTDALFSRLVRQFLFVTLFRACAESLAGENASRIAAMQAAERNINERLHALKSEFAQQRQTAITEELLDVVTGFEALRNQAAI